MRVVGCFLEYRDKFLILHRSAHKPQGGTWCLVSGKVEENEKDVEAMIRELKEETGYEACVEELEFLGNFSWQFPNYFLEFPCFRIKLRENINITHNPDEHDAYKWVSGKECYEIPNLISGLHDLLKKVGYVKKKN